MNDDPEYVGKLNALLDQQLRDRYELQLLHTSQRLRLAREHGDSRTVSNCQAGLARLTADFRDYGSVPLFTPPGDLTPPHPIRHRV